MLAFFRMRFKHFLLFAVWAFAGVSYAASSLEIVAELQDRPANPAITADGRIFLSQHPLSNPSTKVVELLSDGRLVPFPNESVNASLANVIGIKATTDGMVWLLDMGGGGKEPKLLAWDLGNRVVAKEITISKDALRHNSFLQDMAIDTFRQMAYIADMTRGDLVGESKPAIIAVDLREGTSRRLMENHPSFAAGEPIKIDGLPLATKTSDGKVVPLQLGLNPITIDPKNEWVYYGSVNGKVLWRIRANYLADVALPASTLALKPERFSSKGYSDGITIDNLGNVYVTDIQAHGIGVVHAKKKSYTLLIQDNKLLNWPDGMAFAANGFVYVTVNQLNKHSALNRGQEEGKPPYYLVRFRPLVAGTIGR